MYIDTHCHLSEKYYDNIDLIVKENLEQGVFKIIASGCSLDEISESLEIMEKYNEVFLTIGFHPDQCNIILDQDLLILENICKKYKKIVGIGEIGLDYYYGKDNRDKQIQLFEKQLNLAERLQLPVVIHSRDAVSDTINCLKKYQVKGIIHCFSGSLETANTYIKMGFKLGIGGVVTFKNSKLGDVLKKVSLDHLVLETDSPYLCPEPYRGELNSSKYIPVIAKKIGDIYNVSLDEVGKVTSENAIHLFFEKL